MLAGILSLLKPAICLGSDHRMSTLGINYSLLRALLTLVACAGLAMNSGAIASPSNDSISRAPAVTSIVLESHGCFASCPVFRVTLDASGKGLYEGRMPRFEGRMHTKRIGVFDGEFNKDDFVKLTTALERVGLERSVPDDVISPHGWRHTIVVGRGKSESQLRFYAEYESSELWAGRALLESFVETKVTWRKQEQPRR